MRTRKKWVCKYLSVLYISMLTLITANCSNSLNTYTDLVWSDEFNGTSIDATKWIYDLGIGHSKGLTGWGNNELQFYTSRSQNVRIEDFDDGNRGLVIEAKAENYTGSDGGQNFTRNYTSARLLTQGLHSWDHGRIEARIKLPKGQGLWPAFWMLGDNVNTIGWPLSGEIDIMEYLGSNTRKVLGTFHYGNPGHVYSGGHYTKKTGLDFASDFNVFGIVWSHGSIRWYVNDTVFHIEDSWKSSDGYPSPFDRNFFLLLNLAVGGNLPGDPDASTVFPQKMYVDWVRVYQ